jgi:WD40 repeat protein
LLLPSPVFASSRNDVVFIASAAADPEEARSIYIIRSTGNSTPVATLPGHFGGPSVCLWSPIGSQIITAAASSGRTRLWQLPAGLVSVLPSSTASSSGLGSSAGGGAGTSSSTGGGQAGGPLTPTSEELEMTDADSRDGLPLSQYPPIPVAANFSRDGAHVILLLKWGGRGEGGQAIVRKWGYDPLGFLALWTISRWGDGSGDGRQNCQI